MKILFVNHLLDSVTGGGTAERTFQLARYMARDGHDCSILTLDIGVNAERRADLPGVKVHALPCLNKRYFVPRASSAQIRRMVASADVVHLSGHWTLLNAMTYQACKQTRTPYLFCPAGALGLFGRSLLLKRTYEAWVGRAILRDATFCVAITEDEAGLFRDRGVDPQRVAVIPNGIDPQLYDAPDRACSLNSLRQRLNLGRAPYILFLGRLSEIKGPDILLEAFAMVASRWPDHQLIFAGPDDGLQADLQARTQALGLAERVHFAGFLGGSAKAAALHGAAMLAIPSRREAMSIVVLEAGMCGCPVLFTNACGLETLARDGAGIEVDVTAHAIAEGIAQVLGDLPAAANRAEVLKSQVQTRFLWSVQAQRYATLCAQISEEMAQ